MSNLISGEDWNHPVSVPRYYNSFVLSKIFNFAECRYCAEIVKYEHVESKCVNVRVFEGFIVKNISWLGSWHTIRWRCPHVCKSLVPRKRELINLQFLKPWISDQINSQTMNIIPAQSSRLPSWSPSRIFLLISSRFCEEILKNCLNICLDLN